MAMYRGVKRHENSRMWAYVEWSDENPGHFVLLGGQEFTTQEEAEEYSKGFAPGSYEHQDPGSIMTAVMIRIPARLKETFKQHESILVALMEERYKQVEVLGYDPERDSTLYGKEELALAAAAYMIPEKNNVGGKRYNLWPWRLHYWKPTPEDRKRELIKAIALGIAEFKRLLK